MSRSKVKVVYLDGREVEAKVTPRVEVEVEKHFASGLQALGKDAHAEHVYYLAWAALHYSKLERRNFDDFLSDIEDVEMVDPPVDDDGIDDPTIADQPSAQSLS